MHAARLIDDERGRRCIESGKVIVDSWCSTLDKESVDRARAEWRLGITDDWTIIGSARVAIGIDVFIERAVCSGLESAGTGECPIPCQDIEGGIRKATGAVQTCRRPNIGEDKVVAMIVIRRAPVIFTKSTKGKVRSEGGRARRTSEDFGSVVQGFAVRVVSAYLETMREQMRTFDLQAVVLGARKVAADDILAVSRIQSLSGYAVDVVELLVGKEPRSNISNVANGEEHIPRELPLYTQVVLVCDWIDRIGCNAFHSRLQREYGRDGRNEAASVGKTVA